MTQVAEANDLDNALSVLQQTPEEFDSPNYELDGEVTNWARLGVRSKYLQEVQLSVSTPADARKFARQLVATWNGALIDNQEFGYLCFSLEKARVRQDFESIPARYVDLHTDNAENERFFVEAMSAAVNPHVSFVPDMRVRSFEFDGRRIGYLRISSPQRLPIYVRRSPDENTFWDLPVWNEGPSSRGQTWEITQAGDIDGCSLFVCYLQTAITAIRNYDPSSESRTAAGNDNYSDGPAKRLFDDGDPSLAAAVPDGQTGQAPLKKRLFDDGVSSLDGFLRFLTHTLLSKSDEERAISVFVFSKLADVCGVTRERIVRLLLGLLMDERMVTRSVLDSLKVLARTDTYYYLRHNHQLIWDDMEIRERLVLCLAELAPASVAVKDLIELWKGISAKNDLHDAFDQAINRIYERHRIERFDSELRQHFEELIYACNYSAAADVIRGASPTSICIKIRHRACLLSLLNYAQMRIESDFESAKSALENCRDLEKHGLAPNLGTWLDNELDQLDGLLKKLPSEDLAIIGNYLDIERRISDSEISDLYNRVNNLTDLLTRRLGEEMGIVSRNGTATRTWIAEHPKIAIDASLGKTHRPLYKHDLAKVFRAVSEQDGNNESAERLWRCAEIVNKLAPITGDRNKSRSGHGTMPVIDRAQVTDIEHQLSELIELVLGVLPELSSYRDINSRIRHILRFSDIADLTIEDVENL